MTHGTSVGWILTGIGLLLTILLFIYSRTMTRFDTLATSVANAQKGFDDDLSELRDELEKRIQNLSEKISRQSKAITRVVESQRVQIDSVRKLSGDQELLEQAVAELKTSTRLLEQAMTQHQSWHRDMLVEVTRQAEDRARAATNGA